ncbi:hypothetical protein F5Y16DRAFT_406175 [Xylariaceae sp. FL0255]|nr:hypothetical protein F5Y16DRAFT_406175 [Xylariaceae sp. FL0255]
MAARVPDLKYLVPKNGLKWEKRAKCITKDKRRDDKIARAFRATGALSRLGVNRAIAHLFKVARRIFLKGHGQWEGDLIADAQRELDWAQELTHTVFWDFFRCLLDARNRWVAAADESYPTDHPSSVFALIAFQKAMGKGEGVDADFYRVTGGFDNEKNDDQNAMDIDVQPYSPIKDTRDPAEITALLLQLKEPIPQDLEQYQPDHLAEKFEKMDIDENM